MSSTQGTVAVATSDELASTFGVLLIGFIFSVVLYGLTFFRMFASRLPRSHSTITIFFASRNLHLLHPLPCGSHRDEVHCEFCFLACQECMHVQTRLPQVGVLWYACPACCWEAPHLPTPRREQGDRHNGDHLQ